jgi:hypothetical protein
MIDKLQETCLFFNMSPKRAHLLKTIIEKDVPEEKNKRALLNLCATRWAERHDAYTRFEKFYPCIIKALELIAHGLNREVYDTDNTAGWDRDTKKRAEPLLKALTSFEFIMTFQWVYHTLSHLEGITIKLQGRANDIFHAHAMIEDVRKVYGDIREDIEIHFDRVYSVAVEMARSVDVDPVMPRIASRMQHRSNVPATSVAEYYRRNMAVEFVDHIIAELDLRFNDLAVKCSSFQCLVPSFKGNIHGLKEAVETYTSDLPSPQLIDDELHRWNILWNESTCETLPSSAASALKHCDADIFPNIYVLLKLACTQPVTNCECERNISALRRLNNFMRACMHQERLTSLALIHINYDFEFNIKDIVDAFYKLHPRCFDI